MIVSIAIAVLPVCRSPMINSRWPRPIGIIASIAFRPVCIGCLTGWRWTTPGALNSAGRVCSTEIAPLPSSARPSGSTMRPSICSPTGISRSEPVRLTVSPSDTFSHSPNSTAPTLSDSRFSARPVTPWGSSSISKDMQFSMPCRRAMPSATLSTVPTSVSSAVPLSSPSMRLFRMLVISSGLICMVLRGSLGNVPAQLLQSVANRGVEDRVSDPDDDAAENVRVHARSERDLAFGPLADRLAEILGGLLIELDRAGDLDRQNLVLLIPQPLILVTGAEDHGHAVVLDQQAEEVQERLVRPVQQTAERLDLLGAREVRREEEHRQLPVLVERIRELRELRAQLVELALLQSHSEQRAGIYLGQLLHQL